MLYPKLEAFVEGASCRQSSQSSLILNTWQMLSMDPRCEDVNVASLKGSLTFIKFTFLDQFKSGFQTQCARMFEII